MSESPVILSASQIATHNLCARKRAWEKLEGIKRPPHPSAVIGSRVHEILEDYLRDGTIPDPSESLTVDLPSGKSRTVAPGRIAQAGIRHLPRPGEARVEDHFLFRVQPMKKGAESVRLQGYVDFQVWSDDGKKALVGDHKTTSNFRWMKTPELLAVDPQAAIYAMNAVIDGAEEITLRWVYYLTTGKNPRTKVSELTLGIDEVQDMFDPVYRSALEIYQIQREYKEGRLTVLDIPPPEDLNACNAFGGCYYRDRCSLTNEQKIRSYFRKESRNMGLRDMLEKKKAKEAANTPAPETVEEVETPAPETVEEEETAEGLETETEATAALREEVSEWTDEYLEGLDRDELKTLALNHGLISESSRVRVKGLITLLITYRDGLCGDTEPVAEEAEETADAPEGSTLCVYVGCAPNVPYTEGADFIRRANDTVCRSEGLPHYSAAEYGKGPGMLAQALREIVPTSGHVVFDRGTPSFIVAEFTPGAYMVVRGC